MFRSFYFYSWRSTFEQRSEMKSWEYYITVPYPSSERVQESGRLVSSIDSGFALEPNSSWSVTLKRLAEDDCPNHLLVKVLENVSPWILGDSPLIAATGADGMFSSTSITRWSSSFPIQVLGVLFGDVSDGLKQLSEKLTSFMSRVLWHFFSCSFYSRFQLEALALCSRQSMSVWVKSLYREQSPRMS